MMSPKKTQKTQKTRSRGGFYARKGRKSVKKSRNSKKMRGGYSSAASYVLETYGNLKTQIENSLVLQPGQDVVARQSTQSVPIGQPNANVKGMIKFNGGRRIIRKSRKGGKRDKK